MHYRDTFLEINMDNAFYNIDLLKKYNHNKKIKAVVKANAYGHGLVSFSYILEKYKKVDSFCVSNLDEALKLRENGLKLPILVMGAVDKRHFEKALSENITITIYSDKVLNEVVEFNKPIKVQFKIDTGMNRIGFTDFEEFKNGLEKIKKTNVIIEGIYSHFSSADDSEEYTNEQIIKFKKYVDIMPEGIEVHIQNTAGSINVDVDYVNAIRPGIGLYGINPVINESLQYKNIKLKELVTLKSRIVMIKDVKASDTIGYNNTYEIEKNTRIATVPLGYADGFKLAFGKSFAYINNDTSFKKFMIRGKICMDQIMIEVDSSQNVGDYVTFIGEECKIENLSNTYNISPYEIMTSFSERLYKTYTYKGDIIRKDNQIFK